eukprot:gene8781-1156_t
MDLLLRAADLLARDHDSSSAFDEDLCFFKGTNGSSTCTPISSVPKSPSSSSSSSSSDIEKTYCSGSRSNSERSLSPAVETTNHGEGTAHNTKNEGGNTPSEKRLSACHSSSFSSSSKGAARRQRSRSRISTRSLSNEAIEHARLVNRLAARKHRRVAKERQQSLWTRCEMLNLRIQELQATHAALDAHRSQLMKMLHILFAPDTPQRKWLRMMRNQKARDAKLRHNSEDSRAVATTKPRSSTYSDESDSDSPPNQSDMATNSDEIFYQSDSSDNDNNEKHSLPKDLPKRHQPRIPPNQDMPYNYNFSTNVAGMSPYYFAWSLPFMKMLREQPFRQAPLTSMAPTNQYSHKDVPHGMSPTTILGAVTESSTNDSAVTPTPVVGLCSKNWDTGTISSHK